jgi:ArsR family transcriptional regulator
MPHTLADVQSAAQLFQVLSDPTRLEILKRLRRGERCVCDLMDLLDAAQSRLSFHLRVLREAGLVSDRRNGRWMYYTLTPGALESAQEFLATLTGAAVGGGIAGDEAACCK